MNTAEKGGRKCSHKGEDRSVFAGTTNQCVTDRELEW